MAVRIPIRKGGLAVTLSNGQTVGYHTTLGKINRRRILKRVIDEKAGGALAVFRALVARRTLGKNRMAPEKLKVLTEDAAWVKKHFLGGNAKQRFLGRKS